MAYFRMTSDDKLAWIEARERISLQARQVLRRVLNVALDEAHSEFEYNLNAGGLKAVEKTPDELRRLLFRAAKKELADPETNHDYSAQLIEP